MPIVVDDYGAVRSPAHVKEQPVLASFETATQWKRCASSFAPPLHPMP
jgi:hypothetical protein